ncbi:MAG TPA: SDR family NAD(P)-dependent oxidoreductase [Flavitalea sp.]|nr:SDR family NAD(P)-dependent oxidoreductase [Flavitalea sp.]
MKKVWFITGSARGLGRSLTEAVLAKGDLVVATARNPEQLKDLADKYPDCIYPVKLDVTNKIQIAAAVENIIKRFGRIDILVNNAGFGIIGAAEAYTDDQVRTQLEINLYAPIAITRMVLPYMRKQRSGRILQISSTGGRVGNPGLTIYQAAKFGLGGFSEALAKEVKPLGIFVTSVEPGGLRTDMTPSMTSAPDVEGYESTVGLRKKLFSSIDYIPMGAPDKAADVMFRLVDHPNPPVHLVLGGEAVKIVKQANTLRSEEMEEWLSASTATDADDAVDFTQTELGRSFLGGHNNR